MKLLIFGATGACGEQITRKALANGHQVTVFVRNASKLPQELASKVQVVEASLTDEGSLRTAVQGQAAIISALGPNGTGYKSWNDTYRGVFPSFYSSLIRTMRDCGVSRVLAMTTFMAYDERDQGTFLRGAVAGAARIFAAPGYKEFVGIANTFQTEGKDVDWTVYRVGAITDGEESKTAAGYVGEKGLGFKIGRKDMANWVVEQAEASPPQWVRQMPFISSVGQ